MKYQTEINARMKAFSLNQRAPEVAVRYLPAHEDCQGINARMKYQTWINARLKGCGRINARMKYDERINARMKIAWRSTGAMGETGKLILIK